MIPILSRKAAVDLQQTATFSNATMNGQYGLVMDGFDAGGAERRVGTLQWDGFRKADTE